MADNYKVVYNYIDSNPNSKNYGFVVEEKKTFPSFDAAHRFYRNIIMTVKIIGTPIIERM